MASPADVLRVYLIQSGLAIAPATPPGVGQWPIITGSLPSQGQDNYLSVVDVGGRIAGRNHDDGDYTIRHAVLLMIRCVPYPAGMNKGWQIHNHLARVGIPVGAPRNGLGHPILTVESEQWTLLACHLTVPITKIGEEEKNNRQLFTMNYLLSLKEPEPV